MALSSLLICRCFGSKWRQNTMKTLLPFGEFLSTMCLFLCSPFHFILKLFWRFKVLVLRTYLQYRSTSEVNGWNMMIGLPPLLEVSWNKQKKEKHQSSAITEPAETHSGPWTKTDADPWCTALQPQQKHHFNQVGFFFINDKKTDLYLWFLYHSYAKARRPTFWGYTDCVIRPEIPSSH